MEDDKNENDRQLIEDYLREHAIESTLDEVINNVIERRPVNPYVELSKLLETKTQPEIIEVNLSSTLAGCSSFGVRATILTNVGTFIGEAALPYLPNNMTPLMKDYTTEQVQIEDALKNIDPLNYPKQEAALLELGIDSSLLLAVSIACLRGASKFKGIPLYKYIAELASTEPQFPLPVCTVLSRCVGDPSEKLYQSISLHPIASTTFLQAVETLLQGVDKINRHLFTPTPPPHVETPQVAPPPTQKKGAPAPVVVPPPQPQVTPMTVPLYGCPCLLRQSMDAAIKMAFAGLRGDPLLSQLRLSVDCKAPLLFKMAIPKNSKGEPVPNAEEEMVYGFNGSTEPSSSGTDVTEMIISSWKECQLVSLEDPLHSQDIKSLRQLKERIAETLETLREEPSGGDNTLDHSYTLGGVGGEEGCCLQIVADKACNQSEDIRHAAQEAVYNSLNVRFDKVPSIMSAIELCKTAHEVGWSVIISTSKDTPETMDTFLSDFAVGIGSSQLHVGGLHAAEYSCKFNRILDISNELPENSNIQYLGSNFRK